MNQEKISIRNTIKEKMRHLTTEKVGEMSLAFVPTLLQHPRIVNEVIYLMLFSEIALKTVLLAIRCMAFIVMI